MSDCWKEIFSFVDKAKILTEVIEDANKTFQLKVTVKYNDEAHTAWIFAHVLIKETSTNGNESECVCKGLPIYQTSFFQYHKDRVINLAQSKFLEDAYPSFEYQINNYEHARQC